MKGSRQERYTIDNIVSGTHNLLTGTVESSLDNHVVNLVIMGVYGYGTSGGEFRRARLTSSCLVGESPTLCALPICTRASSGPRTPRKLSRISALSIA